MQEAIKACPYCGGEVKLPDLTKWPYLYPVMLCTGCMARGPISTDPEMAETLWNYRIGARAPGVTEEGFRECPHCAGEEISQGDSGKTAGYENYPGDTSYSF